MSKTIGILAGMGPRSTAPFVDEVVTQCQKQYGARHDQEFPPMMIYSLPTPFYVDRTVDHEKMAAVISAGLQRLEGTSVSFIAMPCNSAHRYYAQLAANISVPLLNMIAESVACPEANKLSTILGTRGTLESGMYQQGLAEANIPFTFEPQWQDLLDALISGIKTGAQESAVDEQWRHLLTEVEAAQVEQVVVACTDLQVVLPFVDPIVAIIDASRCLAVATVREYLRQAQSLHILMASIPRFQIDAFSGALPVARSAPPRATASLRRGGISPRQQGRLRLALLRPQLRHSLRPGDRLYPQRPGALLGGTDRASAHPCLAGFAKRRRAVLRGQGVACESCRIGDDVPGGNELCVANLPQPVILWEVACSTQTAAGFAAARGVP